MTVEQHAGDAAIEVRGLRKSYDGVERVHGIDFSVAGGEIFGLLGTNGAGKTTTIEILEGLTPHDSGHVEILGGPPGGDVARQKLGIALQETQLIDKLTVEETLRLFRSFYAQGRGVDELITRLERREFVRAYRPRVVAGREEPAIAWTTAASATAVVRLVRDGILPSRGFLKQETVPFDAFLGTPTGALFETRPAREA